MRVFSLALVGFSCWWLAAPAAIAAEEGATALPPAPPPVAARYVVPADNDPCCVKCPRWNLTIGAWLYGLEGTVAGGGRTFDVDMPWTETVDHLDEIEFAFDGRLRLETGRWRFTVGFDGTRLETSEEFLQGALTVDARLDLWSAYATVGYVIAGGKTDCSACAGTWCLDAYAGVRYWSVGLEVAGSIGALPALDRTESWVDPIVGLHLAVTWPKWFVVLEGDVGGFGVGSEFAWGALGAVGYRFTCNFGIEAGWKVLDVDRRDGDFVFDMTQSGPFVALTFSF